MHSTTLPPITQYGAFHATDGQATFPDDSTFDNGVGTFGATLNTPGSQTITTTDTVTSSITGSKQRH